MKITVAERIAIVVTLIVLSFTAGFFAGRTTVSGSVVIEAGSSQTSPYVEPSAEISPDTSPEITPDKNSATEASEKSVITASAAENTIWTPDSGELLNLNEATQAELENLPEIGPVLAEKIIEYRNSVGAFQTIEDIKNVDGIGDKTFSTISGYIEVDNNYENSGS